MAGCLPVGAGREQRCLRAIGDVQTLDDLFDVCLDRALGHGQSVSDELVRLALRDQREDIALPPGEWYAYTTKTDHLQTSEFANISFDLTSKLNIEGGISHFSSRFSYYSPYAQFAYVPTSPSYNPGGSNKVDYRAGINYKITDHAMVYGVFSQGFRDGGTNSGDPASCYANGVPARIDGDCLTVAEILVRGHD